MMAPPTAWSKKVITARHLFRALLACLFSVAVLMVAGTAHAQSITNIASAQWNVDGEAFSTQSNQVSLLLAQPDPVLHTYAPMPGSSQTAQLLANYCGTSTGGNLSPQSHQSIATPIVETGTLLIGHTLILSLVAPQANHDPGTVDTVSFEITTDNGDKEMIVARETDANSGVFFASIATGTIPPSLQQGDCRLSLEDGEDILVDARQQNSDVSLADGRVTALADPFGMVFDSYDGRPVNGARVTLIEQATGAPAKVFGFDGVTPFPSTLISGQPVTDAAGNLYSLEDGEFVFPLAALGTYRVSVEPPSPYVAPSQASPEDIALLSKPDGSAFRITSASYGESFKLESQTPFETDVPVDAPGASITLTKNVSRVQAQPGDVLYYKITIRNVDSLLATRPLTLDDASSRWLRLRQDSVRVNGEQAYENLTANEDGHGFTLQLNPLGPRETLIVSYVMTVRADAPPGEAVNRATGSTEDGLRANAQANVRIERDAIADRMTLIGRVTAGSCDESEEAKGIPGVRVMLEDGSYAITDETGRYHFEGLVPGTHVVEAASETLPQGGHFVLCGDSTSSAGSASSRFVLGQGGSLLRADFTASVPQGALDRVDEEVSQASTDQDAAGANTDWFSFGNGPTEFLFPKADHNPRSPAVRVAIRHAADQSVALFLDGIEVDRLAFEGTKMSPDRSYAVSLWRGVQLERSDTKFTAIVRNENGAEVEQIERNVHFADTPMRAEIVRDRSKLLADGVNRPVLAVRFLDRYSRPVHSGISGSFKIAGPYIAASAVEARQRMALTGFGNGAASWVVEGDDGVALIELAPTMVSGKIDISFQFSDGEANRDESLEAWIEPGNQPWTLIGLAEGSVGARSIADNMERAGNFDSDLGEDARVAIYAKGKILGKFLLTVAYDSAKQEADHRLLGVIDPSAYYTVFGDASERLFDAASREKLYVRVEGAAFYALYGDFETGFDETDLGRYQRTMTGFKAEASHAGFGGEAFAAKTGTRHRRDEIQGNGLTGPYALSSRDILANSEIVAIEVRDRLRSELIVERRELTRFIDYDIDLLTGTISFSAPVASRDFFLNPQFIIIDYETESTGNEEWNAGLRASWTSEDGGLRVGTTAISDKGEEDRANLIAGDLRIRIGSTTEINAEAALSTFQGKTSSAFSVELEHREESLDVVAYARQIDGDFGVRQQNLAERGRRKFGSDLHLALSDSWSLIASGWLDQSLEDESRRKALELRTAWRDNETDAYVGLSYINDTLSSGESGSSTLAEAGATRRLFDNRLEVSGSTSIALGSPTSIDLPARHRLALRYSVSNDIKLVGAYEIADGENLNSRSLQGGVELSPWQGNRIVTTLGRQSLSSDSQRTFAAFGVGQTLRLSNTVTVDATVDGNRTLDGGIALDEVFDPDHPVSSGGFLSSNGGLGEDFTSFSLGANWSAGSWNARIRGEYRDGEWADRKGLAFAAIRQLGEGSAVGGGLTWTSAEDTAGAMTEIMDAAVSVAHRPSNSPLSILAKLEYRSDLAKGAIEGEVGPAGRTAFTVTGDAQSKRLILSVSSNWTLRSREDAQSVELGLFVGLRQNLDEYEGFELKGTTLLAGLDARIGITDKIDIGGRGTVRANVTDGAYSFAIGPEIGISPAENMLFSVGYNIAGFRDHDFSAARMTNQGLFATFKIKFDSLSLDALGIGRRAQQ